MNDNRSSQSTMLINDRWSYAVTMISFSRLPISLTRLTVHYSKLSSILFWTRNWSHIACSFCSCCWGDIFRKSAYWRPLLTRSSHMTVVPWSGWRIIDIHVACSITVPRAWNTLPTAVKILCCTSTLSVNFRQFYFNHQTEQKNATCVTSHLSSCRRAL